MAYTRQAKNVTQRHHSEQRASGYNGLAVWFSHELQLSFPSSPTLVTASVRVLIVI